MKDLAEMNYSEFCLKLSEDTDDRFVALLAYDDFQVIKDTKSSRYFFLEQSETDASEFFEVEMVAMLIYDADHDLIIDNAGETMHKLFDCDCCGEAIFDDCIQYLWFKRRSNEG